LREARRVADPELLEALGVVKRAGGDQITIHLREDRRHIQDSDATLIVTHSPLPVNLECAVAREIVDIACSLRPHRVTIVPEKREEVTTEGGLALGGDMEMLRTTIERFHAHEIEVSLFVDPTVQAVEASLELGVEWVEFHTGKYANIYAMLYGGLSHTHHTIKELELPRAVLKKMLSDEIENLAYISHQAKTSGLRVAAGHGLNYQNVGAVAAIEAIDELNIGQSIIARSIYTGLERAVIDMKDAIGR